MKWNVRAKIDWIWDKSAKTCTIRVNDKVVQRLTTDLENTDIRKGPRFAGGKWYMVVLHGRGNNQFIGTLKNFRYYYGAFKVIDSDLIV